MGPGTSRCRGPRGTERGGPRRGGRASTGCQGTHLLLLHEAHEGGALDLHGLPLPVVQSQDEVEKVGLPQVGGRLLLEVSPGQTHSAGTRDTRVSGSSDDAASRPPQPPPQPVPSPAGTRLGPTGAEHPSLPRAAPGLFPPGTEKERLKLRTPRSPDPIPSGGEPEAPSSPPSPAPVPTSPPRGPCPLAAGPAWPSQSRRRFAPRSSIGPATSQSRLGAVTAAPMCLILRAFPPAPERWVNIEPRRQLQIFQGCPCRNFPFLRGLQREGCGARWETPGDVNIKLMPAPGLELRIQHQGLVRVWVLFFFAGKRMGRRRNKRGNEAGHSFAKPTLYLEGFLF